MHPAGLNATKLLPSPGKLGLSHCAQNGLHEAWTTWQGASKKLHACAACKLADGIEY